MALFGTLSTLLAQAPRNDSLRIGLDYLQDLLKPGSEARQRLGRIAAGDTQRVELGGGVFALEQVYLTKPASEGRWESHRAYIDIQAVAEGSEIMGVCDVGSLVVDEDLTPAKDLLFYKTSDAGSRLLVGPGEAAIFFPADAHMPCLRTASGPALVRKSVVKVPVF